MALNQIMELDNTEDKMTTIQKEKLYIPVVGNDLPPQTRTVIFLCQYCGYVSFDIVLVQTATPEKSGQDDKDLAVTKDKTKSDVMNSCVRHTNDADGSSVLEKAFEEPSGGPSKAVVEPSFGPSKTVDCSGGPAKAVEEPSAEPMLVHNLRTPSGGDSQDYVIQDMARKFSEVSLKSTCSTLDLDFTLKDRKNVDWLVQQCQLPAIVGAGRLTCYSGLCAVLRRIVHKGLEHHQHKNLDALLGFRQSSLKKCSEVSPWTRLCEIDIYQDQSAGDATPKGILQLERRLSSSPVLSCKLTKPIGKKKLKGKLRTPQDGKKRLEEMQDSVFQSGTLNLIDKRKVKTAKQLHKQRKLENPNSQKNTSHQDPETGLKANRHESRPEFAGDRACETENNCQTPTADKKLNSEKVTTLVASHSQTKELEYPATQEQCCSSSNKTTCAVERPPSTTQLIASNKTTAQEQSYDQNKEQLFEIPTTSEQFGSATCKSEKSSSLEFQAAASTNMTNHQTSNKQERAQDSSHGQTEESLLKVLSVQEQSGTTSNKTSPVAELPHATVEHRFAEGPYVTLTDFALFHSVHTYLHDRLGKVKGGDISWDIPLAFRWYQRMWEVPGVKDSAERCGLKEVVVADGMRLGDRLAVKTTENKVEEATLAKINSSTSHVKSNLGAIRERLESCDIKILVEDFPCKDIHLPWDTFPLDINPSQDVSEDRARHKREQIESLIAAVKTLSKPGDVIVDFCSGGGHVGIVLAHCLPDCHIVLVENNEESVKRAESRIQGTRLTNLSLFQCNLNYYTGVFNIGVALHACGVATDLVLEKCLKSSASFVCSPCCYGSARDSHLIKYPRSLCFRNSSLNYEDHLLVGHTAEQTSRNFETEMAKQAKLCMSIIDTDRAAAARERGYEVHLCSLSPPTCSPKNNLLIGKPPLH